jgi:hypothetical protein
MRAIRTQTIALVFLLVIIAFCLSRADKLGSKHVNIAEKTLDLIAKITAAGGVIVLAYQFKREKDLSEADFILRLNQDFITNSQIVRIYTLLEQSKEEGQKTNVFSEGDVIDMANYLCFFEPFKKLIDAGIIDIKTIDPIMAYRFFLATNNRFMQEMLLCKKGKEIAWAAIYGLHDEWGKYRRQKRLPVWQEESDLGNRQAATNLQRTFSESFQRAL